MMNQLNIVGIRVDNRDDHATGVQKVLTNYGTKIAGRFGVPFPDKHAGLIAVVMDAESKDVQRFVNDLREIEGVAVSSMKV